MDEEQLNEISLDAETLEQWRNEDKNITLLDIREEVERDIVSLGDDQWIPMAQLSEKLEEIKGMEKPLVVYCHHFIRSAQVALYLKKQGLEDVYSLDGGIDYWAKAVDKSLPKY